VIRARQQRAAWTGADVGGPEARQAADEDRRELWRTRARGPDPRAVARQGRQAGDVPLRGPDREHAAQLGDAAVGWTYVGQWMDVADPTAPKGEKNTRCSRDGQPVADHDVPGPHGAARQSSGRGCRRHAVRVELYAASRARHAGAGDPPGATAAERAEIGVLEKKLATEKPLELHQGRTREESGK